jgi:hypothetical protein
MNPTSAITGRESAAILVGESDATSPLHSGNRRGRVLSWARYEKYTYPTGKV